jgi:predicted  nucleic acid-binding Zn-ribbon protein
MNDLICKIGNDSSYMMIAGISLVVLLFIVLMVVVTSMRVKTYKDRFINTQIDNQEKEAQISDLQSELQSLKITKAQNEQELQHFEQAKEKLSTTEENLASMQKSSNELEKLQGQTKSKLDHTQEMHENLLEEHKALKERHGSIQEENSKLHINNARLLMKLETEVRFASQLNNRTSKNKGDKS